MGEEADADWEAGLVEWGKENATPPVTVACRCGWFGDQDDLIKNPYSDVRRCPICDGGFLKWPRASRS